VWSERPAVFEPVEPKRLSLRFLSLRAFSGGQGFARYALAGGYGQVNGLYRALFFLKAAAQLAVYSFMTLVSFPFGRHHSAEWFIKAGANFGKLSILWGARHLIYGRK
jgi:hypothetical protein